LNLSSVTPENTNPLVSYDALHQESCDRLMELLLADHAVKIDSGRLHSPWGIRFSICHVWHIEKRVLSAWRDTVNHQ